MVSTYYTSTTLNVISQERDHMSVSAKELQENYSLSVIFFVIITEVRERGRGSLVLFLEYSFSLVKRTTPISSR
mgnify:CR=1 FL=1